MVRAGVAQPDQCTAIYLHLDIAACQRLRDALFIGVAQPDIAKMPSLHGALLRSRSDLGLLPCRRQGAAAELTALRVIADGLQPARFIGHGKLRKAVVFQCFSADDTAIQPQLHPRRAGVHLDAGLFALAACPTPAWHGVGHLPCAGAVPVARVVDRADGNVRSVVLFERHAGI